MPVSTNPEESKMSGSSPPSTGKPCSRCQTTETTTYLLRKEPCCASCLQVWIQMRLSKRLNEGLRVPGRNAVKKVLLPISGGTSSLALLHLLDLHAAGRLERSGRCGYEVTVVWIDEQSITGAGFNDETWSKIGARFPRWHRDCVLVHDIFSPTGFLSEAERNKLLATLPLPSNYQDLTRQSLLSQILTSLPEPSSRTDLLTSLRTRLLASIAHQYDCSLILWADTTTRLAEKTLASTAKGRGFSLPWQVADGATPFKGVSYLYPLQDIHRREIELWIQVASKPSLDDLVTLPADGFKAKTAAVSTKNQTIDELMRVYFEGVEEQYPSLVANVVRTAAKLKAPGADEEEVVDCGICGLSFRDGVGDLQEWEGNQRLNDDDTSRNGTILEKTGEKKLCYACLRTTERAKVTAN